MLKHLLLFTYVLAFAIGFSTIIFSVLFYLKEKIKWVQYYIVLLSSFTLLLIIYALQLYQYINTQVTLKVLNLFIFLNLGILVYLIPFIMTRVAALKWKKLHNIIFIPVTAGYLVMLILTFALDMHIVFYSIMNALFYAALLYSLIIGAVRLKKITNIHFKIIIGIFILLTSIFASIFFNETYMPVIIEKKVNPQSQLWSFPIYYFWWNLVVLSYLIGYFYQLRTRESTSIHPDFITQHNITAREVEIMTLILMGKTNNSISSTLGISPSTVNNHIANIYEKTGYRSRFELITLIKHKY